MYGCSAAEPEPILPLLEDPTPFSAALLNLDSAFGAPALNSLSGFATTIPVIAGAPGASTSRSCRPASGASPSFSIFPPARPIPDSLLRRVLVLDPVTHTWRIRPDTAGPADGVVFTLYQTDFYHEIDSPLVVTGHAELQRGPAPGTFGSSIISARGRTLAEYSGSSWGSRVLDSAAVTGTVLARQIAFTNSIAVTPMEFSLSTHVDASVSDPAHGTAVHLEGSQRLYDRYDYTDSVDFSFSVAGNVIRITGEIVTWCLSALPDLTITYNDEPLARFVDAPGGPVLEPPEGFRLTTQQAASIRDLIEFQARLSRTMSALRAPARFLLAP